MIQFENCKIIMQGTEIRSKHYTTAITQIDTIEPSNVDIKQPPRIIIKDIADNPEIGKISQQIEHVLSEMDQLPWEKTSGLVMLGIGTAIIIGIVLRYYLNRTKAKKRQQWLANTITLTKLLNE